VEGGVQCTCYGGGTWMVRRGGASTSGKGGATRVGTKDFDIMEDDVVVSKKNFID